MEGLTPPEAYYGGTQSEGPTTEGNIQRGLLRRDTFRGDYHGGTHSEGPTTEGHIQRGIPRRDYFLERTTTEEHIQRGLPRRDTFRGDYHGGTHSEGPTTEGQSWEGSTTEGIMGLGHLPKHLATPGTDSVLVSLLHDM